MCKCQVKNLTIFIFVAVEINLLAEVQTSQKAGVSVCWERYVPMNRSKTKGWIYLEQKNKQNSWNMK